FGQSSAHTNGVTAEAEAGTESGRTPERQLVRAERGGGGGRPPIRSHGSSRSASSSSELGQCLSLGRNGALHLTGVPGSCARTWPHSTRQVHAPRPRQVGQA